MAQDSRRARKARRLKRKISQSARFQSQTNRRQRQRLEERLIHTQFALLAVLSREGDFILTVPSEVVTRVMTDFQHLAWKADKQEDGSLRVILSDQRVAVPTDTTGTTVDANGHTVRVDSPTASETNIPLTPRDVLMARPVDDVV